MDGTRNLLKAARESGAGRVVYASSIHAIQRMEAGIIDESLPYDTNNPYGAYDRSKAEATLEVQKQAQAGLDAVIVCPTGVIGPYDFRGSMMGDVIRTAAEQFLTKPPQQRESLIRLVMEGHLRGIIGQLTVEQIVKEPEIGEEYHGRVVSIQAFGAFVELIPGKDGLLHISRVAQGRVDKVEDVLNVGDEVHVKIIDIDDRGKVSLDRLDKPPAPPRAEGAGGERSGGGDRDRGPRREGGGGGDRKPRRHH